MAPRTKNILSILTGPLVARILAYVVSVIGLALRVEHALTFDGPKRGGDYAVNLDGVRWMMTHWAPFNFTPDVSTQVGYQPPFWHFLGAIILMFTGEERPIAWLAVVGWVVRQVLLALMLKEAIPRHKWSALAALAINAFLPMSVLTDGKLNPEGLHTSLFMVAMYGLWKIERAAQTQQGASKGAALLFGGFSGLAVLTKATAGVLPLTAALVFGWQAWCLRSEPERHLKWKKLWVTAVLAGLAWCVVAGWWCGPNLVKYHHPFPHIWNLTVHPKDPVLYRRPLGWALPFEWSEYLRFPIMYTERVPRANFWAVCVTGMWTDFHNRGFCRLLGGGTTNQVFGANWGPGYGPEWHMTWHCVKFFVQLLRIGIPITIVSTGAVVYMAWTNITTRGRRGTLALPIVISLVVGFLLMFALVYPMDNHVVLNPRYLLPVVTPMKYSVGCVAG